MIWSASAGCSTGSCDRSSSCPPAAWARYNFRRFPPAPMTSCCGAWPPSRKAFGQSDRGCSWRFADSLGSTSDLSPTPGATSSSPWWPEPAIVWLCVALADGQAYLFDARIGLPIPGPDGQGVATLNQALADPAILERMNLPGQSPYGTSRASLLASPSRIGILMDSSQGFLSPRMKLLQRDLAGKNRTILY